jgi:hypothetical protein
MISWRCQFFFNKVLYYWLYHNSKSRIRCYHIAYDCNRLRIYIDIWGEVKHECPESNYIDIWGEVIINPLNYRHFALLWQEGWLAFEMCFFSCFRKKYYRYHTSRWISSYCSLIRERERGVLQRAYHVVMHTRWTVLAAIKATTSAIMTAK